MRIEKRSIALCIMLSIVTCGIYGLYWVYKLTEDTHAAVGRRTTASGGMVILYSIITCSVYLFYWQYKMGESILEAKKQRGLSADQNIPIIYLVLCLFGLAIVSEALLQSSLNDIVDFDSQMTEPLTQPVAPAPTQPVAPAALPDSQPQPTQSPDGNQEDKKD